MRQARLGHTEEETVDVVVEGPFWSRIEWLRHGWLLESVGAHFMDIVRKQCKHCIF